MIIYKLHVELECSTEVLFEDYYKNKERAIEAGLHFISSKERTDLQDVNVKENKCGVISFITSKGSEISWIRIEVITTTD